MQITRPLASALALAFAVSVGACSVPEIRNNNNNDGGGGDVDPGDGDGAGQGDGDGQADGGDGVGDGGDDGNPDGGDDGNDGNDDGDDGGDDPGEGEDGGDDGGQGEHGGDCEAIESAEECADSPGCEWEWDDFGGVDCECPPCADDEDCECDCGEDDGGDGDGEGGWCFTSDPEDACAAYEDPDACGQDEDCEWFWEGGGACECDDCGPDEDCACECADEEEEWGWCGGAWEWFECGDYEEWDECEDDPDCSWVEEGGGDCLCPECPDNEPCPPCDCGGEGGGGFCVDDWDDGPGDDCLQVPVEACDDFDGCGVTGAEFCEICECGPDEDCLCEEVCEWREFCAEFQGDEECFGANEDQCAQADCQWLTIEACEDELPWNRGGGGGDGDAGGGGREGGDGGVPPDGDPAEPPPGGDDPEPQDNHDNEDDPADGPDPDQCYLVSLCFGGDGPPPGLDCWDIDDQEQCRETRGCHVEFLGEAVPGGDPDDPDGGGGDPGDGNGDDRDDPNDGGGPDGPDEGWVCVDDREVPPGDDCWDYDDPDSCEDEPGCEWVVNGGVGCACPDCGPNEECPPCDCPDDNEGDEEGFCQSDEPGNECLEIEDPEQCEDEGCDWEELEVQCDCPADDPNCECPEGLGICLPGDGPGPGPGLDCFDIDDPDLCEELGCRAIWGGVECDADDPCEDEEVFIGCVPWDRDNGGDGDPGDEGGGGEMPPPVPR